MHDFYFVTEHFTFYIFYFYFVTKLSASLPFMPRKILIKKSPVIRNIFTFYLNVFCYQIRKVVKVFMWFQSGKLHSILGFSKCSHNFFWSLYRFYNNKFDFVFETRKKCVKICRGNFKNPKIDPHRTE